MIIQLPGPCDNAPIRTAPASVWPPPHTVWAVGYQHGPTRYSAIILTDAGDHIVTLDSTDPGFLVMDVTLMGKLDATLNEKYPDGWQIRLATPSQADNLIETYKEKYK